MLPRLWYPKLDISIIDSVLVVADAADAPGARFPGRRWRSFRVVAGLGVLGGDRVNPTSCAVLEEFSYLGGKIWVIAQQSGKIIDQE